MSTKCVDLLAVGAVVVLGDGISEVLVQLSADLLLVRLEVTQSLHLLLGQRHAAVLLQRHELVSTSREE